jgi:DNA mismatch repair protein MutS2
LDRLVFNLEDKLKKAETLHREAVVKESRFSGLIRLYESRLESLQMEAEIRKQKIIEEADHLLQDVNAMKEKVLKEIRESKGEKTVVQKIQQDIQSKRKTIQTLRNAKQPKPRPPEFHESDWVGWRGHSGAGRVISAPDRNGKVLVEWNDIKVRISTRELDAVPEPDFQKNRSNVVQFEIEPLSHNELDLRGKTADEAIEILDRFIPNAVAAGFASLRIIHGKGTGVLRKEVQKYMEKHPLIKSQRLGDWNEGDTGVTVVEFK